MENSLFKPYIDKYFEPVVLEVVNRMNESDQYMFKQMLSPEYTPTLKWSSLSKDGQNVIADVVSMDSSLPLKRRQKIESAQGKVPKLGMMKYLGEEDLTTLDILQRQNQNGRLERQLQRKLFNDTQSCLTGIWEQQESMFLQGLSTGVTAVADPENEGVSIRLDYGYPAANTKSASVAWSGGSAAPLTDIRTVRKAARKNGDQPRYMLMNETVFGRFVGASDVKELYAANIGISGANIPTPNKDQINAALRASYNLEVIVVDRSVTYEVNGVRNTMTPFDDENVVFLNDLNVGSLTWGTLAELNHPNKNVDYVVADEYILLSKYREVNPLREFTSSQALAVPVINNVNSIYLLTSETT